MQEYPEDDEEEYAHIPICVPVTRREMVAVSLGGGEWFGAEGAVFGGVVACFWGSLWAKLPNRERRGCNEKWPRKQWEEEGVGLIKRGRVR